MRSFKILTFTLLLISVLITVNAQTIEFTEIKSKNDWTDLLARAESLKKPVFLDIYASWCGPCKQMDKIVFANPEVAGYYNDIFINSKIDGESEFGMELVRQFGLRGYPTMYFLSHDNFLYTNLVGFRQPDFFLDFGKKVDENKSRLRDFAISFEEGTLVGERVKEYLDLLTELDNKEKLAQLSDLYISTLTEEELSNPENKGLILNSNLKFEDELFGTILTKWEMYSKLWGEEEFQTFLEKVFQEGLQRAAINKDIALRDRLADEIMSVYFKKDPEMVFYGRFLTKKLYHAMTENWDGYIKEVESYYSGEKSGDVQFLLQEVNQILRNQFSSKELLVSAAKWIDTILEQKISFEPYYLGAIIYIYLEDFNQAKKMVTEAEKYASSEELETLLGIKKHIQEKGGNE